MGSLCYCRHCYPPQYENSRFLCETDTLNDTLAPECPCNVSLEGQRKGCLILWTEVNCKQEKAFPAASRFRRESLLTTQTATDLRGICGNDGLQKCWKANETEQKWTKQTENIIKNFKFRLVRMRSAVRIRPAAPRKQLISSEIGCFSLLFATFAAIKNCGLFLTTALPTDREKPASGIVCSGGRDSFVSLPVC